MRPQLRFIVSERCNLCCRYCHNRTAGARWPLDAAPASASMVRHFAAAVTSRGLTAADLSLYGGEPLLNTPFLDEVLRRSAELRREGFDYSVILNTNATLVTPETARMLAAANVEVHVSLDGADEHSNARRVNHAGR
ncbi:MAG: radical SAM protein, partial [Acidobacteria bacterium]|nr:radical SAM protein [Acidobacteriota bacterium]